MKALKFKIYMKPGTSKTDYAYLVSYHKNFTPSGRFLLATGMEVKRSEVVSPGRSLKNLISIAEKASIDIREEGLPLTSGILKQRIDLMVKRIIWDFNNLSIWVNDKAHSFIIPESVDKEALTEALNSELTKVRPDLKATVSRFLSEGEDELFGFWQAVLDGKIKPRGGKKLRPSTVSNKRQTLKLVKAYNPRLTFADMDMKFYNGFTSWLEEKRVHLPPDERRPEGYPANSYDRNSIGKHFKALKAILHLARKNELIDNDKFSYWSVTNEANEVVSLSKEEVTAIMDLELTGTKKEVRDLFIMACFLGPRIGDFSKIVEDNFDPINGVRHFSYVQEKTGASVAVPVLPPLRKFMEPFMDGSRPWPKMISEVNFRDHLHTICKAAKLDDRVVVKIRDGKPEYSKKWEAITPHSARRTFASALYYGWWSKPLPAILVMRYTGHKSEKSFMKYIGASDKDLNAKALEILELKPLMRTA